MLIPSRRKPTLDNLNKNFNNTLGEQTHQFNYFMGEISALGGTLFNDSTSPKKSFLLTIKLWNYITFEIKSILNLGNHIFTLKLVTSLKPVNLCGN